MRNKFNIILGIIFFPSALYILYLIATEQSLLKSKDFWIAAFFFIASSTVALIVYFVKKPQPPTQSGNSKKQSNTGNNVNQIIGDNSQILLFNPAKEESKKELTADPFQTDASFLSELREDKLKEIRDKLSTNTHLVSIVGIGGIGKTELVKYFYLSGKENYHHTAWVTFKSDLVTSFYDAFEDERYSNEKDSKKRYELIVKDLNSINEKPNLLVVDNMNKDEQEIIDLSTHLPNWKIVVTSRDEDSSLEKVKVESLDLEGCRKVFYNTKDDDKDDESLDEIIKKVGFHTLTIAILAKVSGNLNITIKDLLEKLLKGGIAKLEGETATGYNRELGEKTVMAILEIVFDISKLKKKQKKLLLQLSILPHNTDLEKDILLGALNLETAEPLTKLVNLGWLSSERQTYKVHPVIGETLSNKFQPKYKECKKIVQFFINELHCLSEKNPLEAEKHTKFADAIFTNLKEKNERLATLANNLSLIYLDLGNLKNALEFGRKALRIREKVLAKNHPHLAASYNNLSTIYRSLGNPKKALEFTLKAVEIKEKVSAKNHPNLATSYNNMSLIYQDLGNLEKALELGLKVVAINEKVLTKNHPHLATSYNNLSTIYLSLGNLEKALEFGLQALRIREKVLVKDHPDLAQSYNNLSTIYFIKKEYGVAKEYMERAIKILEFNFPQGHPDLDSSYEGLKVIDEQIQNSKNSIKEIVAQHIWGTWSV